MVSRNIILVSLNKSGEELKNSISMEKSETGDEVYFRLSAGEISQTVEITDSMFTDVDIEGKVLGVEWINVNNCLQGIYPTEHSYSDLPEIKELARKYPETATQISGMLHKFMAN